MPQSTDLLSLQGVAQRSVSYRFRLLDRDEVEIGELHPSRDQTATITQDTSRFIQRDMQNLILTPDDTRAVNPTTDRVAPSMVLEDGSEWPLGVFLFTEALTPEYSYGSRLTGTMVVDKGYILDQPVEHSTAVAPGEFIRTAIIRVLTGAGVDALVETSPLIAQQPMVWPPGTQRSQILTDLCIAGGYLPPFFDVHGICNVRTIFDVDDKRRFVETDVVYRDGENVYAASISRSDDLLRAPSRYVVIGANANNEPVVGIYDVPANASFSSFRRGFTVTEVVDVEGIGTSGDARTAARAYGISRSIFEYVSFSGPPDPRHDAYSVVEFGGERWLEMMWSLPLTPSGPMTHQVRRVYGDQ